MLSLKLWEYCVISVTAVAILLAIVLLLYILIPFVRRRISANAIGVAVHQVTIKNLELYCDGEVIDPKKLLSTIYLLEKKGNNNKNIYMYGSKKIKIFYDVFGDYFFNIEILNTFISFKNSINRTEENAKSKIGTSKDDSIIEAIYPTSFK